MRAEFLIWPALLDDQLESRFSERVICNEKVRRPDQYFRDQCHDLFKLKLSRWHEKSFLFALLDYFAFYNG